MSPRGGVLREPRGFVPGPTLKYLVAAYDYGELRIWDVVYFVIKGRIWELAGGSAEVPGASRVCFPAFICQQRVSLIDYGRDGISELTRLARLAREHNIVIRARQI